MSREKIDKEYYDDYLYCRVNKELKKKANMKALEKDMKLYEFINECVQEKL